MYFSGYEGETKEEMFQQLPLELLPLSIVVKPSEDFNCVLQKVIANGLQFPIAVKPDVGTKGLLFRKIENKEQLQQYHALLPFNYVIEKFVTLPLELSIFYVRYPSEKKGKITGLIAKEYLHVTGDGTSSLKQLIEAHPKAYMIATEQQLKHAENLNNVIAKNETYNLNELGNHNRGARFINLHAQIDEALLEVMNEINVYSKHFHYGRYDLKTTSLEDFKQGKNIAILEFNGVGSEPNHIYDIGLSYRQAIAVIAQHWKYMYEIGRINYAKGIAYIPFLKGVGMFKKSMKHTKLMKQLELQCKF